MINLYNIISVIDILAVIAFLIAGYYAVLNNKITNFASPLWDIFGITVGFGAMVALAAFGSAITEFNPILIQITTYLICFIIGLLAVLVILAKEGPIKLQ